MCYFGAAYERQRRYLFLISLIIITIIIITTIFTRLTDSIHGKQHYVIENVHVAVSRNTSQLKHTLVIVAGQVRTLGHVWKALLSNVIQPNEPCDVIFSIDGKREDIPDTVMTGLGPRIIAVLTTESEKSDGLKEFWLIKRTIRKIHFDRYHFIVKTRTDLYHRIPIPLQTIFGESEEFISRFHTFYQALMMKIDRQNFSAGEVLYSWFMTAGMVEFIPTMLIRKPQSPWSKLHQHEWNKNLKLTLTNCTTNQNLTTISGSVNNYKILLQCFKLALERHKIVYNIGSTWIQFGHSKHMIPIAIKIADQFGNHTWAAAGFDDRDTLGHGQWKRVTESQMRLTFLKEGYNLIDLVNAADYQQTFLQKFSFQHAKVDKQFLFFVVRQNTIQSAPKVLSR